MAAANAVINILALGVGGLLSAPALVDFFSSPLPDKIQVNIGAGATNSSEAVPDGQDLKGNAPRVTLFDINGVEIGSGTNDAIVSDGGSVTVTIEGKEGSDTSKVPQYIQLSAFGSDPICVSWLTTSSSTSSGADFRSWNGAAAKFCDVPWYPSVAPMPGVTTLFQPPCFWLSNTGEFVVGMSARLVDFFFPGTASDQSNQTATQWQQFPDTLCNAPGRQQFYKNLGVCIAFYPSGLSVVNQKDPETGFDADFDAIQSSHTHSCSLAGIPFNNVDLGGGKPTPAFEESLLAGLTLKSAITPGLGRRADATGAPVADQDPAVISSTTATHQPLITEAATLPEKKQQQQPEKRKMKEPVLDRRVEKRHEEAHRWCQEHHLVVSEHTAHSAVEVCESASSWGPDFVAVAEGVFCDMCNRQLYPLCGNGSVSGSGSGMGFTNGTTTAEVTIATAEPNASEGVRKALRPAAGPGAATCFNMQTKQLRVPARLRRSSGSVPVKRYQVVKHWK
ncbi:hypothetical protein PG991_015511 [Apiospora marii]|uniref:Uncharacterized protein n=1 Tax=Apiospora marii TaxID=335849 RepID=A0ABR1R1W8_9PEZI